MQSNINIRYRFNMATYIFAITFIAFFLLSILHPENVFLHSAWQASISVIALINSINAFQVRKQKLLGFFLSGLFVLSIFCVFYTIFNY
jgi:hypothetical protein